jgi:hypothetical protein
MCCNGVLFKDVEVQPSDHAGRLAALGLDLKQRGQRSCFSQPCAALGTDCRCRIYPERPARCREFDCALLQSVQAGTTTGAAALRVIRQARRRADRVLRLLRLLGDHAEDRPLAQRVRSIRRRLEATSPRPAAAKDFAALTLAAHDLNLLLAKSFYR